MTFLDTKHNFFVETGLKFSEVIFRSCVSAIPRVLCFRLFFISFSVQVIPYCLYNIQVRTLWRLVYDCQCFITCFSLQMWFYCISSVLGIEIMLINKTISIQALSRRIGMVNSNLFLLFIIHDPISSDNIASTTGRHAAPNQDRPYTMFHQKPQALNLPTLLLTYFWRLDPKISNWDSLLHNTLFHWSSFQSLWYIHNHILAFSPCSHQAAILPKRPFLTKLLQTVEGSTWHLNGVVESWSY